MQFLLGTSKTIKTQTDFKNHKKPRPSRWSKSANRLQKPRPTDFKPTSKRREGWSKTQTDQDPTETNQDLAKTKSTVRGERVRQGD
jgi:hypothetical protein